MASPVRLTDSNGVISANNPLQTQNYGIQPDGDLVSNKFDGEVFNTEVLLAANATYTSDWIDTDGWSIIELIFTSEVPSARRGIVIEYTDDANVVTPTIRKTNFYSFKETNVRAGSKVLHLSPLGDGFRVKYTNGPQAQATFYLSVVLRASSEPNVTNKANVPITGEFLREVALGNMDNYESNTKFGRNHDVDSGSVPEDVWNGGGNYTGHNATANENLQTFSSSAADVGTLVSSGTVTSTATDKLIDSAATFITDGVAVGDVVLNDSEGTYGSITSIDSETQVTVFRMLDGSVGQFDNITGDNYRIATTGSTGAAVVKWTRVLNSDYERQGNYFVILNGTTAVTTTGDFYRLSRGTVILAGSGGANAGTITARQATTTANVFAVMPIARNQTLIAADTVPKDEVFLIENLGCRMTTANGTAEGGVVTFVARPKGGVFNTLRIYDVTVGGPLNEDVVGGLTLAEGTDFKFSVVETSGNNIRVSASVEYLEIFE